MKGSDPNFTFTVPLTAAAHQTAEEFYHQHASPQKAKQVYLNTLGVQAVNFYLQCLHIATDLEGSESFNPVLQTLADLADLQLTGKGRLECRTVLSGQKSCLVPPEVWSDRIGYVIVQLDRELTEATLLGFIPQVDAEELPLRKLQSLQDLPAYLSQFVANSPQEPAILSHWLHNLIDAGWQTIESLWQSQSQELAFSFRAPLPTQLAESSEDVKLGKKLPLQEEGKEIALCVGLTPIAGDEVRITVEVYPLTQAYLPPNLQLTILDEDGKAVLQGEAGTSEGLEFRFRGFPGEGFSVKVVVGEIILTEAFVI